MHGGTHFPDHCGTISSRFYQLSYDRVLDLKFLSTGGPKPVLQGFGRSSKTAGKVGKDMLL